MSANVVWKRLVTFFPELVKGNSGAAPAVDWTKGNVQSLTLNAATVTPTFVAPPGGCELALVLTQDGTGGRNVVWPVAVTWVGGTAPILLAGASQSTLVNFYFDGTTYFGSLASAGSPSSLIPWTAVAAGTALAASLSKPNLACDTSAAQSNVTLPTATNLVNADGFEFTIKATGNMLSPVIMTAGAGTTIELLNTPGTYGASTWMPIQGMSVILKYDKANTQWKAKSIFKSGTPEEVSYNPGWYAQTVIAFDPANSTGVAADSNTGVGAAPLLTFQEIVRRYGGCTPQMSYGQSTTINQGTLAHPSPQPAGQDEIYFEPIVSGGGSFILNVALASAGADFAAGALSGGYGFAAAVPSAGGIEMTMAAVPAYVVASVLLENTARASYAFVDAVTAGNATLSQPMTKASLTNTATLAFPAVDNDWVAGDNIKAWQCQLVNLGRWSPKGSDRTAATKPCAGYVQFARIPDISTTGRSSYNHYDQSDLNVLQVCQIDGSCQLNGEGSRGNGLGLWGCVVGVLGGVGRLTTIGGNAPLISGGICRASADILANGTFFSNNAVLHGTITVMGTNVALGPGPTGVFLDGTLLWSSPCSFNASSAGALGFVWGSFACTVSPGAAYVNNTGSTFALKALLTNGALKLGTSATGTKYSGAGVMVDGVALTPANIDAGGAGGAGLFSPTTGARFCNAA